MRFVRILTWQLPSSILLSPISSEEQFPTRILFFSFIQSHPCATQSQAEWSPSRIDRPSSTTSVSGGRRSSSTSPRRSGTDVYAQGGIIVDIVSAKEAIPILRVWKGRFDELKAKDIAISRPDDGKAQKKAWKTGKLTISDMVGMLGIEILIS